MAELELRGRIMPASNATFLGELDGRTVVYKPIRGERPLWDFPDGTLAAREVAASRIDALGGFDLGPETVWRDGPAGPGAARPRRAPQGRGSEGPPPRLLRTAPARSRDRC